MPDHEVRTMRDLFYYQRGIRASFLGQQANALDYPAPEGTLNPILEEGQRRGGKGVKSPLDP